LSNDISDKDKKDWQRFISNKDKVYDKDIKKISKPNEKIRSLDLHGYTLDEANKLIENFINKSYQERVTKLILVTGKGLHSKTENDPYVSKNLSILKYSVPEFIRNNENLMKKILEIKGADIKDEGSGAFYIYLKKI
jgi:DNA-nicking Smr family endonuclease